MTLTITMIYLWTIIIEIIVCMCMHACVRACMNNVAYITYLDRCWKVPRTVTGTSPRARNSCT